MKKKLKQRNVHIERNTCLPYKQRQRGNKPEYSVSFSKENGEYDRVARAAKSHHMHKMPVSGFVHVATLAYINQTYIVPDRMQVARLEQLLSESP